MLPHEPVLVKPEATGTMLRSAINLTLCLCLSIPAFLGADDVRAQTSTRRTSAECVSLIEVRTAALVASDWQQLDRLAKQYIQGCTSVHDAEAVANAHSDIATSQFQLGNMMTALSAADTCINVFYASASCHFMRTRLLLESGRLRDARAALAITEKLVAHLIAKAETDLQRPAPPSLQVLNHSRLNLLRAIESAIDTQIRPQLLR